MVFENGADWNANPQMFDAVHSDKSEAAPSAVVIKMVLGFWATEFVTSTSLWVLVGVNPLNYLPIKIIVSILSIILTFAITWIIGSFRFSNITYKIFLSFPIAVLAALAATSAEFGLFHYFDPLVAVEYDQENFCYTLFYQVSLFLGWACFFIAHMYNLEARAHERRFALSREEALNAKMQALHYQINPHFLFNTLNSIVGLIEEGSQSQASRMVMSLSSFVRKTLELDPFQDLTLAEELALQTEYLGIEKERFSDRLSIALEVPQQLRHALIPSLILQPLVENAIKHGLGLSSGYLKVAIKAFQSGDSLNVCVENISEVPGNIHSTDRTGLGIGLANVAHRIQARFPHMGSLVTEAISPTHFRATLTLPLRVA